MDTKNHLEPLLTVKDVAAMLAVSPAAVYAWRHRRFGPPGIRVGNQVRFRRQEVEAWLDSQAEAIGGEG